jgi:deoxycytidylate deaminase
MFELAKRLSYKSNSYHKLGCVIANRNRVVSVGFNNMNKTHPKANTPWKTLHAEMDALIGVDFTDVEGCTAYVYRELKSGRPAISKPCSACELALRKAGIAVVYYTTDGGWDSLML